MKVINQIVKDKYSIYHGDSVEVIQGIPDNSIHYSIFSPPLLVYILIQIVIEIWEIAKMIKSFINTLDF